MTHLSLGKEKRKRFCLERIHGNCLERVGIKNGGGGGYAIIDRCAIPKVGDIVHCLKHFQNIGGYIKQVKRIEGNSIIVGTAYIDESKDFEFEAGEILGVVIETYGQYPSFREYIRPTHLRKKKARKESEDTE